MTPSVHRRSLCRTQAILSNARCWVEHMQLNQSTGLDPEGVMLRASECAAPEHYAEKTRDLTSVGDLDCDPDPDLDLAMTLL
jgi:hypothetical protein